MLVMKRGIQLHLDDTHTHTHTHTHRPMDSLLHSFIEYVISYV